MAERPVPPGDCRPRASDVLAAQVPVEAPTMEMEEGQVKQRLEDKDALAARLGRSPDLLDALLMTFTFRE